MFLPLVRGKMRNPLLLLLICCCTTIHAVANLRQAEQQPVVVTRGSATITSDSAYQVLDITKNGDNLKVTIGDESVTHAYDLTLDTKMFSPGATVTIDNEQRETFQMTTKHTFTTNKNNGNWGTATIEDLDSLRIAGVFSIQGDIHTISARGNQDRHTVRRLVGLNSTLKDIVVPIPGRAPTPLVVSETSSMKSLDNVFFPNCYPGDQDPLLVQISIATDLAFRNMVAASTPGANETQKTAIVLREIEKVIGPVRSLYLSQLNVQIQIANIVMGTNTSSASVLRRIRVVGAVDQCADSPVSTLSAFGAWAMTSAPASAHWHLFTDCHPMPGAVGAGYEGGLCDQWGFNAAVSSWEFDNSMWTTVGHEMGHVFGASHTFYGGQGGIMDYGNGQLFGGAVQFHPDNRPQICGEITRSMNGNCPYMRISHTGDQCGNGVLELGEQCECTQVGQTECGYCSQCVLVQPRQCSVSSESFVVRQPSTPDFISVTDASMVAHNDCCSNGKLVGQSCNNNRDVCSATGTCQKACAKYLVPPCGFDQTGCIQKCFSDNKCQGAELVTMGPPVMPAGAVPDGVKCVNGGVAGLCSKGVCVAQTPTPTTFAPTAKHSAESEGHFTQGPSFSPSSKLVASWTPTLAPTQQPSNQPTIACPRVDKLIKCPGIKDAGSCTKNGCVWCGKSIKCQASSTVCKIGTKAVKSYYASCPPFNINSILSSRLERMEKSGDTGLCPSPEEMSICATTNSKKTCAKNTWLRCQWCGSQDACLPASFKTDTCSTANCPLI